MSTAASNGRRGPSLLNRALAGAKREVSTVNLEAFQRAGAAVFELDLLVDARRAELHAAGTHPWEADGATASLFLATWVARVHQTLGSEVLAADHTLDPRTRGYVPPATHKQAWAFFQPVALWLTCARRAGATPDYWIGDDVELPAGLPSVLRLSDAPRKHLKGLLVAADAVDRLVEQQLGAVLSAGEPPARWRPQHDRLRELAAQARSALHYAQALWHPDADRELEDIILRHLQPALVMEHHLGQFLALPELLDQYRSARRPARRPAPSRPWTI
jgi:hypothetical protein